MECTGINYVPTSIYLLQTQEHFNNNYHSVVYSRCLKDFGADTFYNTKYKAV